MQLNSQAASLIICLAMVLHCNYHVMSVTQVRWKQLNRRGRRKKQWQPLITHSTSKHITVSKDSLDWRSFPAMANRMLLLSPMLKRHRGDGIGGRAVHSDINGSNCQTNDWIHSQGSVVSAKPDHISVHLVKLSTKRLLNPTVIIRGLWVMKVFNTMSFAHYWLT